MSFLFHRGDSAVATPSDGIQLHDDKCEQVFSACPSMAMDTTTDSTPHNGKKGRSKNSIKMGPF